MNMVCSCAIILFYVALTICQGKLVGVTLLGQPIIVVNDKETAFALLEKTGSALADRPTTVMLEMTGWTNVLACQLYGHRFREYRKVRGTICALLTMPLWAHAYHSTLLGRLAAQVQSSDFFQSSTTGRQSS